MRLIPTTQPALRLIPRIRIRNSGSRNQFTPAGITTNNTRRDPLLFITLNECVPVSLQPISGFTHRQTLRRTLRPRRQTRRTRLREILRYLRPRNRWWCRRLRLQPLRCIQPCPIRQRLIQIAHTPGLLKLLQLPRSQFLIPRSSLRVHLHPRKRIHLLEESSKPLLRHQQLPCSIQHVAFMLLQILDGRSPPSTARLTRGSSSNSLRHPRTRRTQFPTNIALNTPETLRSVQRILKTDPALRANQPLQRFLIVRHHAPQKPKPLIGLRNTRITSNPRLSGSLIRSAKHLGLSLLKSTTQPLNATPLRQRTQSLYSSVILFPKFRQPRHVGVIRRLQSRGLLSTRLHRLQRIRNLRSKQVSVLTYDRHLSLTHSAPPLSGILNELQPCSRITHRQHHTVTAGLNVLVRFCACLPCDTLQL